MTLARQGTTVPSGSAPKKSVNVSLDLETAVDLADYFVARNKPENALQTLHAVVRLDPYNAARRAKFAELLFAVRERQYPVGTVERSRFLLQVLGFDCLSKTIEDAYFENLKAVLDKMPPGERRGSLVLGLGPGRCGSTTLAAMLRQARHCCATHENPPLVHWIPDRRQLAFHEKRFDLLLDRFAIVFDSAHWWLNAADDLKHTFADLKLVGLVRDSESCAESFLRLKGAGAGSINHWVAHDGLFWKPALWDALYPNYDLNQVVPRPLDFEDPAAVRDVQLRLITRYVDEYYAALSALEDRFRERLLIVRTGNLSDRRCQGEIADFIGVDEVSSDAVYNRDTTEDGMDQWLRF